MTFEDAVKAVYKGQKVSRYNWNDPNKYMYLQKEKASLKMHNGKFIRTKHPSHVDLHSPECTYISWVADDEDMIADDWYIIYNR